MPSRTIWSKIVIAALVTAMAASIAGCGRRGSLELSPEAKERRATLPTAKTPKDKTVVDRPFVLDPLL